MDQAAAEEQARRRAGLLLGIGAYLWWGAIPLYYRALEPIAAIEIVAQRTVWALPVVALIAALGRRGPAIRAATSSPKVLMTLTVTTMLMAVNLLVYVHAVTTGQLLEASLGYYLNPLVNIVLGMLFLNERLGRAQVVALLLAASGVGMLAAGAGSGLWISLTLAASFGLYGLVRKITAAGALEGLAVETALLAPFALAWLVWQERSGGLGFGRFGMQTDLLLVLGGAVAVLPLLMFTGAARRLAYSTLGFIQYITPSLQFLVAVLVFGQPLTMPHLVCFAAIWSALAVFGRGLWRSAANASGHRRTADSAS